MADVLVENNEDSENSVVEIEPPKKPAPLVIDLADEEIIINVKAELPNKAVVSKVSWVKQCKINGKSEENGENSEEDSEEEVDDNIIRNKLKVKKENGKQKIEDRINEDEEGEEEEEDEEEEEEDNDEDKYEERSEEESEEESEEGSEDSSDEGSEEETEEENDEQGEKVNKDEKGIDEGEEVVSEKNVEDNQGVTVQDIKAQLRMRNLKGLMKIMKTKNKKEGEAADDEEGKEEEENEEGDEDDEEGDEDDEDGEKIKHKRDGKKTETENNKKDENEEDKQGDEKNEETKEDGKEKENDEGKKDDQAQDGSTSSDLQNAYYLDSNPEDFFSQPSFSQNIYPESSYYPALLRQRMASMRAKRPRMNDDLEKHHPVHWTPEMVKFYDEDWGNERDFELEKLQQGMDKNPSLWQISSRDVAFWKSKNKKSNLMCFNCFEHGHESYNCKDEKRVPKCHMCGESGHIAYNCPQAMCLNCGTRTTAYVTKCKNCKFSLDKVCERCNLTGHIYSECTDHWRLYHSTIGTKLVEGPTEEIYKPTRFRWCCNCGRRGHLQIDCGYCVKNTEFSDTLPFVTSYIKAFTRSSQNAYGYEDPAKEERLVINVNDNIMTNPSQKHAFETKTSQLRNKLRAIKRDSSRSERERFMDRRRHPEGGFNRYSYL